LRCSERKCSIGVFGLRDRFRKRIAGVRHEPGPPAELRYSDADVGARRAEICLNGALSIPTCARGEAPISRFGWHRLMPLGRAGGPHRSPRSLRVLAKSWRPIHQILADAPNSRPIAQFRCELILIKPQHSVLAWYSFPGVASICFSCCRALFEDR
jgi:hypothetical protein